MIKRGGDVLYVLLGMLITFGFWLGPDLYRWYESKRPAPVPPSELFPVEPARSPVAPAPVPDAPTLRESARQREKRAEILQRMAQTCAFWSARDDDESGRIYRRRACDAMRDYARESGQAVPRISLHSAPAAGSAPEQQQPAPVGVYVRECNNFTRGSIAYRDCRAEEKQRLKHRCQYYRQREEWRQATPWCSAAESYPIVQ